MGRVARRIHDRRARQNGDATEEVEFTEEYILSNKGICVYCEKCHPCPMKLDIARINRLYDYAKDGNESAKEEYFALEKLAGNCMHCNHCNSTCPFEVDQNRRMKEIVDFFGE